MLSPSEKLMCAIFGEPSGTFIDYPLLRGDRDEVAVILKELSRQNARYGDITPREERVLLLRFGFDTERSRTLEDVAKEFNLTRERIRGIEAKALRKLRHPYHSRELGNLFYVPTQKDERAVAMRRRLADELLKFFPESLAYEIVMGIKRPYLKKALGDLTTGNIAHQVRLSCGLSIRHCKNCGIITLPNWDFCSRECQKAYKTLDLICDWCGAIFKRRQCVTIYRLNKQGFKHYYCSKRCVGKALGNRKREVTHGKAS